MRTCTTCGRTKELKDFEGNRNKCRECRNLEARNRRHKEKEENPVLYKCKQMAADAHSRVFAESRSYKKSYQNLEKPYEFLNIPDMYNYLYNTFYNDIKNLIDKGLIPSVDRINTKIGYTKDNIRIIDFKENTLLGVATTKRKVKMTTPNEEIIFNSMADCCRYLGYNPKSTSKIKSFILKDGRYKIPIGYTFEYID